jgi:hypothetical protein
MTEAEWLACTNLDTMMAHLQQGAAAVSDRKWRLFAIACARRAWHSLVDVAADRAGIEVAERYVEGQATLEELHRAYEAITEEPFDGDYWDDFSPAAATADYQFLPARDCAWGAANHAFSHPEEGTPFEENVVQCGLLRDILGNPWHRVNFDSAWMTPTVARLAQAAYETRSLPEGALESARLLVLADALEEGGCTDPAILGHLRSPGPHVRGCHVVDLLLGKE